MFSSKKSDLSQNTVLQIKQDDKFFCRLLTKESSMSNPSFRVAVNVPFVWESQPGTPKYTFSESTLPPLTPPPSYYSTTSMNGSCKKQVKIKRSRSNLLLALLPKLNLKKSILSSSDSSSSPSSFSSSSLSSSPSSNSSSSKVVKVGKIGRRRRFLSFGSSLDFRGDIDKDEDGGDVSSPTSTLCFRISRSTSTQAKVEFSRR